MRTDFEVQRRGDGRTVFGIAVPFDTPATVNDGQGPYREVFRSGAFAKMIADEKRSSVGSRVKFLANHNRNQPIGKATLLREDTAGLYAEFRVSETTAGNEALQLIRDGVYDSFSIGFAKVQERRDKSSNLVERLEVQLREVSTLAFPAYATASVMGVRSNFSDEELERIREFLADIDTQRIEAALGTSDVEPSTTPDEPEFGHSIGTPTHSQLRAAIRLRGILQ